MKKYNPKLNKKLKTTFIVILVLLIIVMVGSVIFYRSTLSGNKLPDVGTILEFHGSTLIKETSSSEKGYKYDIYANLKLPPVEEDGFSEEVFYENVVVDLTAKIQSDFRIIDEEKDIIVRVKYDPTTYNSHYNINNIDNYFKIQQAKIQSELAKKTITDLNINSDVLNSIVNNNWERRRANLGTIESTVNNYDIYFDEGYRIKTLGINIYNIVFTKKYNGQVINGIAPGMGNDAIISRLGTPTYTESDNNIIGYKSNDLYTFFSNGEISIYEVPKLNESNNQKFAELFTQLNKDGDVTKFFNDLNMLYPNPETLIEKEEDVSVFYPSLGFRVHFGQSNNGVTIYSNYQGKITSDITMDDLRNGKVPPNTKLDIKTDAVFYSEKIRFLNERGKRIPDNAGAYLTTREYQVYKNEDNHSFDFYSITKNSIDSSLNKHNGMVLLKLDDVRFVYSIPYEGIYIYNAQTLKTDKIYQGTNDTELKLEKIENNILYYDGKTLEIG